MTSLSYIYLFIISYIYICKLNHSSGEVRIIEDEREFFFAKRHEIGQASFKVQSDDTRANLDHDMILYNVFSNPSNIRTSTSTSKLTSISYHDIITTRIDVTGTRN